MVVVIKALGWILVGQSIPSVIETVDIRRMVEHTCRASIWMDEYHSEPLYADDVTFIRVGLIGVPTHSPNRNKVRLKQWNTEYGTKWVAECHKEGEGDLN